MDKSTLNIRKNSSKNKDNRKSVVDKKPNRHKKLLYISSVCIIVFATLWGILYLIDINKTTYGYKDNTFYVQNNDELKQYVKNEDVTGYKVKDVSMTKDGINEIIDTYRKPLYDAIGEEGTKKFKKINYIKVDDVKDDGKTLTVMLTEKDDFNLESSELNLPFYNWSFAREDMLSSDQNKFIMTMAYNFKDTRNILIKFKRVHGEKNMYNEDINVINHSYDMLFNKSDLSRVVDWNTYSVDKLRGLNKL